MASDYVTTAEFKETLELTGESFADADIALAITSASRMVEDVTDRRFWADTDTAQIRYYTPVDDCRLAIDDLVTLTALATDPNGNGTFGTTWTLNTDFVLEPLNAAIDGSGSPWTSLSVHPRTSLYLPVGYPRSVRVTGKFGWSAVPPEIKQATSMLASRLLKRAREAPFGVAAFGIDGAAVRVASQDPDVYSLLQPFIRFVYA